MRRPKVAAPPPTRYRASNPALELPLPTAFDRLASALADRYRPERELGSGGMATVYLARDLRHHRDVALKVLRPELAAVIGAERFLAEIRTTAGLQHPHILPLFDSGEADGLLFYVMPYVEGESLRDRVARERQLPVGDAVRIASEVAGALDYAHRRGVIHRDIKPENVLLHDGRAVVADFGIALAVSTAGGGGRMTETGMSLGTPHYMSPEQAMGERDIGPATDVYALGAVTYELLIGEPPFTGSTAQAVVARVVTENPRSLTAQRHTVPANVEAAVLTALEKLPADRFATAAEFATALHDRAYRGAAAGEGAAASGDRRRLSRGPALAAAGVAVLLVGAGAMALAGLRDVPQPVTRYGVSLPDGSVIARAVPSPDGSAVLLEPLTPDTGASLWIRYRDRYDPEELPGTRGAANAVWAPDGSALVYYAGGQVRRMSLSGGPPVMLADSVPGGTGLAWLEDGTIVFGRGGSRFDRVAANGGQVTTVATDTMLMGWPEAVPGRSAVIYTSCPDIVCSGGGTVRALDLGSGSSSVLVPGAVRAWAGPEGSLIYVRTDGTVYGVPFDFDALEARGPAVPLLDGVMVVNALFPLLEISRSGTMAYRRGGTLQFREPYELVWIDRGGVETPVDPGWRVRLTEMGENYGWSLSPDGRRLAIGLNTDQGDDIWVKELPDGPLSRVTFDSAAEFRPTWTPAGLIAYGSNRPRSETERAATELYTRRADGAGSSSLLLHAPRGAYEVRFSPDGRWLLFRTGGGVDGDGGRDIMGIRPGIDTAPVPLVATQFEERAIALSPDGRWLAYESNETGRSEVFLRPFPDTEAGKWQISSGGGQAPLWSHDGSELFYVNATRDMVAAPFTVAGGEPRLGARNVLFRLRPSTYLTPLEFYTPHDVAPDGRFIMARLAEVPDDIVADSPVIVVQNWFAEVERQMGR